MNICKAIAAILGLERIDRFQAGAVRNLSFIPKYRFPIKLGMTGDEKEIGAKVRIVEAIVIIIFCSFLSCKKQVYTNPLPDQVDATFQLLLEEAIEGSFGSISGISMSIISPKLEKNWAGVEGFDSTTKDKELNIDQPFRIASITKTFVAVAILRLHEIGTLSIEDPISKHILPTSKQILIDGSYDPDAIKIKHCLNHSSGLFDYAMGNRKFIDKAKSEPKKRWTRQEQLEWAMESGEKVGEPGGQYSYGDTGYILLGEIIEQFFEKDLAQGLRTLLKFNELQLDRTWLETLEPEPENMPAPVHRYFGRDDVTLWDPSTDLYGGGGLMSTSPNLAQFFHALFNHQIYDKKETLELMLTKNAFTGNYDSAEDKRFKDYRYGVWNVNVYDEKAYIHNGLWGSQLIHIPAYNTTIATNFTKGKSDRLLKKVILVIKNIGIVHK